MHRTLEVFGNPLGCVQGVPDSVTDVDVNAFTFSYDETARCGDNCTEHTVYVPSDGVCVQCPNGTHAHGVGALNCAVLSPTRFSPVQSTCCSVLQHDAVCCSLMLCVVVAHEVVAGVLNLLQCVRACILRFAPLCNLRVAVCCSVLQCVAVYCSVLQCVALRCSVL